jgi:hypothetical protein
MSRSGWGCRGAPAQLPIGIPNDGSGSTGMTTTRTERALQNAAAGGWQGTPIGAYSGTSHLVVAGHLHAIGPVIEPAVRGTGREQPPATFRGRPSVDQRRGALAECSERSTRAAYGLVAWGRRRTTG